MASMIKIACQSGGSKYFSRDAEGEVFGAWAAHDGIYGEGFKVTFLRFGLAIPFVFPTMEDACNAAEKINALRQGWDDATREGIVGIRSKIMEIAETNGGVPHLGLAPMGEPESVDNLPG